MARIYGRRRQRSNHRITHPAEPRRQQREVDDWRTNMIRQFTEKIDSHAEALKSLIEEQVK